MRQVTASMLSCVRMQCCFRGWVVYRIGESLSNKARCQAANVVPLDATSFFERTHGEGLRWATSLANCSFELPELGSGSLCDCSFFYIAFINFFCSRPPATLQSSQCFPHQCPATSVFDMRIQQIDANCKSTRADQEVQESK